MNRKSVNPTPNKFNFETPQDQNNPRQRNFNIQTKESKHIDMKPKDKFNIIEAQEHQLNRNKPYGFPRTQLTYSHQQQQSNHNQQKMQLDYHHMMQ